MNLNGGSEYHSVIRMEVPGDPHEELIRIQNEFLTSLRTSHRLFVQKFHFETCSSLIAILIFIVVEVIFYSFSPESIVSGSLSVFVTMAVFAILSGIRIKKGISFLRWSKTQLQKIDKSATPSQIHNGLPFYISELFTAAYAGTLIRDPVDKTPESVIKEIEHQEHRGKVVFIVVICLVVPFIIWMIWVTWSASPVDFQQAFLVIFLCGFIAILIGIFTLAKRWVRSVHQWVGYYYALDRWGNVLEHTVSQPKKGGL